MSLANAPLTSTSLFVVWVVIPLTCIMLDTDCWNSLEGILSTIEDSRQPRATDGDAFGRLHLLLFGETPSAVVATVLRALSFVLVLSTQPWRLQDSWWRQFAREPSPPCSDPMWVKP